MVDVSAKAVTERSARASGLVRMNRSTLELIKANGVAKGNVCEVARLAGIMAAKRTGELIPLCHPLGLDSAEVSFEFTDEETLTIEASVKTAARTGVEMEALLAVSVAALTVYDMCKSVDKAITIDEIRLEEKQGGRSGSFRREREQSESDSSSEDGASSHRAKAGKK
jgi:cyclic pyranopterin phosphate synthase